VLAGSSFNAVAIVRGGGDAASLEIFNDPALGAASLNLQPLLITALGHTVNETLLDKLADKKFALPHDYGNTLKVWVDTAIEEQSKSKSTFINQVRTDLTKTFQDQITSLQNQLNLRNKEFTETELKFKALIENNQKDKTETVKTLETAFHTHVLSLQASIKIKEDSIVNMQATLEKRTEQMSKENNALRDQLQKGINRFNVVAYILLALILGLIIGMLLR
jgi:exonuclease VII large subunit